MTNPIVATPHLDYVAVYQKWQLVRDIINNNAKSYIRDIEPSNPKRNNQYKDEALLTNFTNLTKVGLTGLVFRKKPTISLPPELNYIYDNITGSGINIYQFSQSGIGELLQTGRIGLLVDSYRGSNNFYIKPYIAENILNWEVMERDGKCILSELVLKEYVPSTDNRFNNQFISQYRVLCLEPQLEGNYIYKQEIYNYKGDLFNEVYPTTYDGEFLDNIPFIFSGAENNDWQIDYIPLYDMAAINLSHYRNSADLEESVFINGQPTIHLDVGETTEADFMAANPGGLRLGSRRLLITRGGSAQLLQCNPNQFVAQTMKDKIEQAAAIGARLIAPPGVGRETAEGVRMRYASQNSALYTLTSNFSWSMENALKTLCLFQGANPNLVKYILNRDFYEDVADPNLVAQQIMLLDRGVIGKAEIRDYGRRTGFIDEDKTDQQLDLETEQLDPLAGTDVTTQ